MTTFADPNFATGVRQSDVDRAADGERVPPCPQFYEWFCEAGTPGVPVLLGILDDLDRSTVTRHKALASLLQAYIQGNFADRWERSNGRPT